MLTATMRLALIGAFGLLVLFDHLPLLAAEVPQPLGPFAFQLDYYRAYQSTVRSGSLAHYPSTGPYFESTFDSLLIARAPSTGLALTSPTLDNIRFYSIVRQRLTATDPGRNDELFSFAGGFRYQFSSKFGALLFFNLDREKALDPAYTGKKWRGLAGDIETSAIYFQHERLRLTLGKQRVFWGPQPVNLILSETAEPLDLFTAEYAKGLLAFSFLFARLDGSRPDSADFIRLPERTFRDNRYLVGHRLDINFHRTFRLGLFETSLFGGEGRPPELYYLNPLQFFHTAQLNEGEDDNTILGMDFHYLFHTGYAAYGQLIVDDYQIDNATAGDQEPNELGLMLGAFRAGQPSSLIPDLKLEYVRITNRTYHQRDPRNRYLFRNKLLGHPLGPDADSLTLTARFWPTELLSTSIELAGTRHGEGSIYASWDEPWTQSDEAYSEPFPTGVVQKSIHASVRVDGYLPVAGYVARHFYLSMRAGYGSYRNYANVEGHREEIVTIDLGLSWLGLAEIGLH
jgi:hypothetical protein